MSYLNYKKHYFFLVIIFLLINENSFCQSISFNDLTLKSNKLEQKLINNNVTIKYNSHTEPYFESENSNFNVLHYESFSTIMIIDFQYEQSFLNLKREIQKNSFFIYKYCSDFNDDIIFHYKTKSGNKISFSLNKPSITITYPSALFSFIESNSELKTVFVCLSNTAYAFHTNLKCSGLGNCDSQLGKSTIKEAKKFKYQMCEICSDDNN